MKIIELDIIDIFEGVNRDELIKSLEKKRRQEYIDMVLKKMHELIQKHGDRQSIGGYAFDVSRYLGGAISGRELEQMYRKKYMNESQVNEWGRIVKDVNTTVDVGTDEIKQQAAKFGNTVDKDGFPPTMSKKTKGKSTNVLYNLGMVKESEEPRYTAREWAIIEGGHTLEETVVEPKKPGKLFTALTEGYKLQLERDEDVLVLHIKDNATGKRTEVRGKLGYETNGYDPKDRLHQLLDVVGKSANISELMNGEVVTINPKHPDAERALAATDRAYNEAFDTETDWVLDMDSGGIQVFATKIDDAYIELTYKRMSNDDVYIAFSRGGRSSVTGEGSQNKIFGAVINHIQKWVNKNKPPRIVFSAFKPRTGAFGTQDTTRSSLYRRMVQRFANQNGYDYDVEDTGNEDTFILTRKEKSETNEALNNPYPVRWSVQNDKQWYGHAKEENSYDQIGISIKQISDGVWDINFSVNDTKQKSGGGDQFKIFATVQAAIKEWWNRAKKNNDVTKITFSAERIADTSRAKLYQRFAKQFADAIGYTLRVDSKGNYDTFNIEKPNVAENFADGKKPGRKGLAKRSGVNTKASVSSLRKTAKNSSGEKQRMAHWLANMKAGKAKKK